ncbi:MAG TPA: DUF6057 family protein [Sedimentisphaerales bacterium]|nr:DUF6057 family protein [Sedimentisphaerales bacterium]
MKVAEPIQSKYIRQRFFLPLLTAVFFGLYYLYVYLCVEPTLFYHGHIFKLKFPVFSLDVSFIKSFLVRPSGFVECLSSFLSQFYYYSWAGALVITLIGWLFYMAAGPFVKHYTGRCVHLLRFVPAVGFLLAYNQYIHCLEGSIKILLAVVFALVYIKMPLRRGWMRWTVFLLLSVLLYCGAGSGGLLFAWFCCLYEIRHRRFYSSLWCFVSALAAAYVLANYLLDSNLSKLWLIFPEEQSLDDPIIAKITIYSYLVFGLIAMVMTFLPRLQRGTAKVGKSSRGGKSKRSSSTRSVVKDRGSKMPFVIRWSALLAITAGIIFFMFDRMEKNRLRIYYYGYHRKWPELLRQARGIPVEEYNLFLVHYVNRALLHTGKLGDEMFSYPLASRGHINMSKGYTRFVHIGLRFEFGLLNDAEQLAHETLELFGSHPMTLKQLALINIAKGQTDTARVFLNALSKDLIFGRWARDCLKRLETDPLLLEDERIRRIRTFVVTTEPLERDNWFNWKLQNLVKYNGNNTMAYEYLMVDHLLNKQLDGFVMHFQYLDHFGYADIPRHYQEAILIYAAETNKNVNLGNHKIAGEIQQRFDNFRNLTYANRNEPRTKLKVLLKEYSDTYFYYYLFYEPQ